MHAPFAYWRKRHTENAFYTVKAKCSKCKRHFFYNDSTRLKESYFSCSRINYKYLKTNRIEIKM